MPQFFLGICAVWVFGCIWHYNSNNSQEINNWLIYYDYAAEPIWDRLWASLYFTTSNLTTTGYGDISPHSISEMMLSILMMVFGVIFFSFLMTGFMKKFRVKDKILDEVSVKLALLRDLRINEGFF